MTAATHTYTRAWALQEMTRNRTAGKVLRRAQWLATVDAVCLGLTGRAAGWSRRQP